jgi:hypothetical protein
LWTIEIFRRSFTAAQRRETDAVVRPRHAKRVGARRRTTCPRTSVIDIHSTICEIDEHANAGAVRQAAHQ